MIPSVQLRPREARQRPAPLPASYLFLFWPPTSLPPSLLASPPHLNLTRPADFLHEDSKASRRASAASLGKPGAGNQSGKATANLRALLLPRVSFKSHPAPPPSHRRGMGSTEVHKLPHPSLCVTHLCVIGPQLGHCLLLRSSLIHVIPLQASLCSLFTELTLSGIILFLYLIIFFPLPREFNLYEIETWPTTTIIYSPEELYKTYLLTELMDKSYRASEG